MKIEEERKLFEIYEHSKNPFAQKDLLFEVFTKDGLDESDYGYIGKYINSFMQEKWELWLASAKRQGYKLVPVEPTEEMVMLAYNDYGDYVGGGLPYDIYKAMIGGCDDN